ncbi:MAG: hypothetical protein NC124_16800 [Clostridium sp.]|nr:hypothetical protein [Bacteroidales bacterium]MCM1207259.1 hypothetical protein [Bacillota bacterium]MCM1500124.1 hypothetical protein [Clostridium sp.]
MKRALFILTLLIVACTACNAQVCIKSRQLDGTTWKVIWKDKWVEKRWVFSSKELKETVYLHKISKSYKHTYAYYLTPTNSEPFLHKKAGTSTSGKFLYLYDKTKKERKELIIESFDQEKGLMTVRYIAQPMKKGTGPYYGSGEPVIYTLKRMSNK